MTGRMPFLSMLANLAFTMAVVSIPMASASAQNPIAAEQWRQGFHGFNLVAQGTGLELLDAESWLARPADERVLIAIGRTADIPWDLNRFHQQGISIAIATEFDDRSRFRDFGFSITSLRGRFLNAGDVFRYADCPIVRELRDHRMFRGVESLVCNRPAKLLSFGTSPLVAMARFPETSAGQRQTLAAILDDSADGRFLCIADSSLFSNQMLLAGDNARFADQACRWLSENRKRSALLLLVDGQPQTAVDPDSIRTLPPPPTRKQVLDAIKSLPPEALLEFGNSVISVVEDENMVNDFLQASEDRFPPRAVDRFFLMLSFTVACMIGLVTYFWQKRLLRKTATDVTARRQRFFSQRQKQQHAHQRQQAATALLNSLSLEWGNRRIEDWPDFPQGLDTRQAPDAAPILEEVRQAHQQLRQESKLYWTPKRLAELQTSVQRWRTRLDGLELAIEPPTPMG